MYVPIYHWAREIDPIYPIFLLHNIKEDHISNSWIFMWKKGWDQKYANKMKNIKRSKILIALTCWSKCFNFIPRGGRIEDFSQGASYFKNKKNHNRKRISRVARNLLFAPNFLPPLSKLFLLNITALDNKWTMNIFININLCMIYKNL